MATRKQMYIYGNTVRQPEVLPRHREEQPSQPKKVSRQVKQNRKRALHMSGGYVMFLAVAAIASLFICVNYLQLRAETTKRSENITALQRQLADVKEANNTAYYAALDSVTLDMVKDKAINQMGMVQAQPEQVIFYQSPSNDYVKQYENIPKSGVLSSSRQASR